MTRMQVILPLDPNLTKTTTWKSIFFPWLHFSYKVDASGELPHFTRENCDELLTFDRSKMERVVYRQLSLCPWLGCWFRAIMSQADETTTCYGCSMLPLIGLSTPDFYLGVHSPRWQPSKSLSGIKQAFSVSGFHFFPLPTFPFPSPIRI